MVSGYFFPASHELRLSGVYFSYFIPYRIQSQQLYVLKVAFLLDSAALYFFYPYSRKSRDTVPLNTQRFLECL
jgi:hypothetical protein